MQSISEPARAGRDAAITGTLGESDVIRRHSGTVAWPTVVLFVVLVAAYAAVVGACLDGLLSLWAGTLANALLVYALFTVHHDANHKAISGRNARWRWLDQACGTLSGVLLHLSYKGFTGAHLRHHANTNDPAKDPDAGIAGPLWTVVVKWLLGLVIGTIAVVPGVGALVEGVMTRGKPPAPEPSERVKLENRLARRSAQLGLLALAISIPLGLFAPAFLLWWLPTKLAALPLMVFFSWLPHVPFDSTERFHNTRIATFRGSTWLLLQQDRHLIHHLYPSVPWYQYRAVFRELRPLLEAHGARIEGRETGGRVPITTKVAPAS